MISKSLTCGGESGTKLQMTTWARKCASENYRCARNFLPGQILWSVEYEDFKLKQKHERIINLYKTERCVEYFAIHLTKFNLHNGIKSLKYTEHYLVQDNLYLFGIRFRSTNISRVDQLVKSYNFVIKHDCLKTQCFILVREKYMMIFKMRFKKTVGVVRLWLIFIAIDR